MALDLGERMIRIDQSKRGTHNFDTIVALMLPFFPRAGCRELEC
jgi:hypothetical protein